MATNGDDNPLGLANGDQEENGSESETGADDFPPDVVQRIKNALDKPHDGSKILLDWNAFEPGSAIRENDVKHVWERLLRQIPYNRHVASVLRKRMYDLKTEMLKYAKNKAYNCMIQACMRRELNTELGMPVNSITSLRKVRTKRSTTGAFHVTNTLL
jgi:6-pyruvoyl-tetrahydropterin synthase